MTNYELHRVCEDCFNEPRNPPIREKIYTTDGSCRTCGRLWKGINVTYYPLHLKWYRIRDIPHDSMLSLCNDMTNGRCMRGVKCRRAHNPLELEIWISIDSTQRPGNGKIMCNEEYKNLEHLNSHMMGQAHETKRNTGSIRSRPNPTSEHASYELCREFARQRGVCRFGDSCKFAHSKKELKVWMDVHKAENVKHRDRVLPNVYATDPGTSDSGNDPNVLTEVYEAINRFGMKVCVLQPPNHIQLRCEGPDTVSIKADESPQVLYLLTLKVIQPEFLNSIVLYQHRGIFTLRDIYKCSLVGDIRENITHQNNVNNTDYLVFQEFDSDNFLEVSIIFRPQIGGHKVFVIFQLQDGLLLAKEINVNVIRDELMVDDMSLENWGHDMKVEHKKYKTTGLKSLREQEQPIVPQEHIHFTEEIFSLNFKEESVVEKETSRILSYRSKLDCILEFLHICDTEPNNVNNQDVIDIIYEQVQGSIKAQPSDSNHNLRQQDATRKKKIIEMG